MKKIRIGEVIKIKGQKWVITEKEHKNGLMSWKQPTLILLENLIKNMGRKKYYKGEPPKKKFNLTKKMIKNKGLKKLVFNINKK